MTLKNELTQFNPWDPGLIKDPHPIYARYREVDPVHWGAAVAPNTEGAWYLFGYEENARVLGDVSTFASNPDTVGMGEAIPPSLKPVMEIFHRWLAVQDRPAHTRLRSIVVKAFTPARIEAMRPRVEEVATALVKEALDRHDGKFDIISDLSFPIPMTMVGDEMGVSRQDWGLFRLWSEEIITAFDEPGDMSKAAAGATAVVAMAEYFRNLAESRRGVPGDDLLTAMVTAADEEAVP